MIEYDGYPPDKDDYPPDKDDLPAIIYAYLSDGDGAVVGGEPWTPDEAITFWPAGGGTFNEVVLKDRNGQTLIAVPLTQGDVYVPQHGSITVTLNGTLNFK